MGWFRTRSNDKPRGKGGRPRGSKTRPPAEILESMKVAELRRLKREAPLLYQRAMQRELGLDDAPAASDDLTAMRDELEQRRTAGRAAEVEDADPINGHGSSPGIAQIVALVVGPLLARYAPQIIENFTRGLATSGTPGEDSSPRQSSETDAPVTAHLMDEAEQRVIEQRFKAVSDQLKLSRDAPPPADAGETASPPSEQVAAAEPADLSAPIIAGLEGRDPKEAADWLQTNGAIWTWVLVPELQQTPDAERPARLAELGNVHPGYRQLAEWLLARPDWLQATVDRLRSQHAP